MTPEEIAKLIAEDYEQRTDELDEENAHRQFLWVTASGNWIINAESWENAYDKVIRNRVSSGQPEEDAKRLFEKDDKLFPIDGDL